MYNYDTRRTTGGKTTPDCIFRQYSHLSLHAAEVCCTEGEAYSIQQGHADRIRVFREREWSEWIVIPIHSSMPSSPGKRFSGIAWKRKRRTVQVSWRKHDYRKRVSECDEIHHVVLCRPSVPEVFIANLLLVSGSSGKKSVPVEHPRRVPGRPR